MLLWGRSVLGSQKILQKFPRRFQPGRRRFQQGSTRFHQGMPGFQQGRPRFTNQGSLAYRLPIVLDPSWPNFLPCSGQIVLGFQQVPRRFHRRSTKEGQGSTKVPPRFRQGRPSSERKTYVSFHKEPAQANVESLDHSPQTIALECVWV